jgi:hypothetical protein
MSWSLPHVFFAAALSLASACGPVQAQIAGGVNQYGTVIAGDCAKWYANGAIEDGGAACASGNADFATVTGNVANNVVTMANTTTGVKDSGVAVSSLAPKASPTFSGTVSLAPSGVLQLGNAYASGIPVVTGYLTVQDNTGTTYKIPACTGC